MADGLAPASVLRATPPFGTRIIRQADIRPVETWVGRADIQKTIKYPRYAAAPWRFSFRLFTGRNRVVSSGWSPRHEPSIGPTCDFRVPRPL